MYFRDSFLAYPTRGNFSRLFEIALVLVRLDHARRFIGLHDS